MFSLVFNIDNCGFRLIRVPQQLSDYPRLETLFLNNNELTSLDGAISRCRALERINLRSNQIHTV